MVILRLLFLGTLILPSQLVLSTPENPDPTKDTIDLFSLDSSSIIDDTPTDGLDLYELSSYQNPDQLLTPSTELLIAADSESCHASKKERDGESCAVPITVEIPSLLNNVFGIGGGGDETEPNSDADANAWDWSRVVDPCVLRTPYIIHLCCHGPLGVPYGFGWTFLDKCVVGTCISLGLVNLR